MWSDTRILVSFDNYRVLKSKNLRCEITELLFGPLALYPDENKSTFSI